MPGTRLLLGFALAGMVCAAPSPAGEPADLVVKIAAVWTGDEDRPAAHALAVRDGRFVYVGNGEAAVAFIGDETRVIDAEGRRVLPGLMDAHVHLAGAADDFQYPSLREARSREHLLEIIETEAAKLEPDDWFVGVRWTAESWPDQRLPTADEIEQAAGGRRAVLIRMDGHMLLASRSALEYAEITADGPDDPAGGRIGRMADGTPDGALYEQAMGLVRRHVAPGSGVGRDDLAERFRRAIREANRVGITQVGAIEGRGVFEDLLIPLDDAGELTLRVRGTVRAGSDRPRHWQQMLEWAAANQKPSPNVRILGFKGFMDGTLGSRTAWMHEPYLDNPDDPDNAGFPLALAGSGQLAEYIQQAAGMGLQPAVHAIGDKANHTLLNWYAGLTESQRADLRPRIEHAQHLLPGDIERFAELGVVASMQPLHKADDGRYAEQRLGPERVRTSYAFRDLLDAGAVLAFGSDWPVVSVNPFLGIHGAAAAQTIEGETFLPEQSITVEEAITAYTRGVAYALHNDDETGMIKPGYLADFIILDRDILAIDHDVIPQTEVLMTVFDGRVVFEREE